MYTVLIVIHAMVTFSLIGIILVQRSSTDGMGLSGGGSNSFLTGRAAATFVTRATAVLAGIFILLSLAIGILTSRTHTNAPSIVDKIQSSAPAATTTPAVPAPATDQKPAAQEPAKPSQPSVPRPE